MSATGTGQLRIVPWAVWLATVVVAVCLVGGITAAVVGGPFTSLGSGAGGRGGIPSLVLDLAALTIGIPAAVVVARRLRTEDG